MKRLDQIYEGKAKKVYKTEKDDLVIVSYKDDATAFNGQKKGTIEGKGAINNQLTNHFMKILERNSIRTQFVEEISKTETIVKKVKIIPLEVIVRNIAAGSFSKRYGVEEGFVLKTPTLEFSLKNDDLGDPLIGYYHILALNIASKEEIEKIKKYSFKINEILREYLLKFNIKLIDFKLEFGKTEEGEIILADEISPDTCRFWDKDTNEKLDKDRFRRNMLKENYGYEEIFKRIFENNSTV